MPASVAHSTGPPGATKCFNCQQIGHYKANCPELAGRKATIATKSTITNTVPTQTDMSKLLANMMLAFFTALAGSQPATPSVQASPLPMQVESTATLQSRVKSLENEKAEQAELISQLYLRIAELTETVSALSNQLPMLNAPATATEMKKEESKLPPGLGLQTDSDAKLSNAMPSNSHTIKKEPVSKQEQENKNKKDQDSKKCPAPTQDAGKKDQVTKRPLTLSDEITRLQSWITDCKARANRAFNGCNSQELHTRATHLATLCDAYEKINKAYPAGSARLKAIEDYDASHPFPMPTDKYCNYPLDFVRQARREHFCLDNF